MSETFREKRLPTLGLVLVSIIWGAGFIATQIAIDTGFSAGQIMLFRFVVASLALFAAGWKRILPLRKQEILCGLIAGLLLFLGFYTQTVGLRYTTPSNNGFFTATNVIMVPLIAWALQKKRPPLKLFFCSLMALAGFFILAWRPGEGFSVNGGDLLTLLCAFFFACHIASLGILSAKVEPLRLTFLQVFFAAVFSLAGFLALDRNTPSQAQPGGIGAVLFLGLFSTCLCFFVQTWAQSKTSSGKAAVIMSTESLWCMLFSVALGYERLSAQMLIGGLVIVGAVCLLEVDYHIPRPAKKEAGQKSPG